MNIPRYLRLFTHGNATSVVLYTEAHATSLLGPIRRLKHDFLVLITVSSKSSLFSKILSNFTRSLIEGANNKISSAYKAINRPRLCRSMLTLSRSSKANKNDHKTEPCLTSRLRLNSCDLALYHLTQEKQLHNQFSNSANNSTGIRLAF